jgi:hypothetical protein
MPWKPSWSPLLDAGMPPAAVAERLKNAWSGQGVVNALFASMAFSAALAPPVADPSLNSTVREVFESLYFVAMVLGFVCASASVVLSVLYYLHLNRNPGGEYLSLFIRKFEYKFAFITAFFQVSIVSMIIGVMCFFFSRFGIAKATPWIVFAVLCLTYASIQVLHAGMNDCTFSLQWDAAAKRACSAGDGGAPGPAGKAGASQRAGAVLPVSFEHPGSEPAGLATRELAEAQVVQ